MEMRVSAAKLSDAMSAPNHGFCFKLRGEIQRDATALHGPLTGATYPLSETAKRVVEAIDAQLSVEEQLAKIERTGGIQRPQAERELRQLLLPAREG
jgi:hypothetical protein